MVDVEVRVRALAPPRYPHSTLLRTLPANHHVAYLLGDDERRFVVAEREDLTVLVAGPAVTAGRLRERFATWAAAFSWGRLHPAVRTLKEEAGTSFVAIVVSPDRVVVFGDPFGSVPLFHSTDGRIVATNPDAVGHATGAPYDAVSYADMVATKRVCHPFTLYEGVRQLSPTAYIDLSAEGAVVRESRYRPPRLTVPQLLESAAVSLERTVADHVDGSRIALAMSGGLDSRILASVALRHAEVRSFSITEKPSRDATIATLVAGHRRMPHQTIVLGAERYAAVAPRLIQFATSQNGAQHAHFVPIVREMKAIGDVLVTGYGSNANFERYDALTSLMADIAEAAIPAELREEVTRRWSAHAAYVREVLRLSPFFLASTWPSTQKKAFAFVPANRQLMPTVDPFLILPEMFSAKAHLRREPSDLAVVLFRQFCGDEMHLPTTRHRHPLRVDIADDPSAGESASPWPSKEGMFKFGRSRARRLRRAGLQPAHGLAFRQLCAVEAVWGPEPAGVVHRLLGLFGKAA